jgi:diguanylate cyclase (GGDEF)-like protein
MSALFFIDLDRFKELNDSYGHRMGDELLVAVGERLARVLRRDELSRIGRDSCQGFYFGAPMSAFRLDSLIRRSPS